MSLPGIFFKYLNSLRNSNKTFVKTETKESPNSKSTQSSTPHHSINLGKKRRLYHGKKHPKRRKSNASHSNNSFDDSRSDTAENPTHLAKGNIGDKVPIETKAKSPIAEQSATNMGQRISPENKRLKVESGKSNAVNCISEDGPNQLQKDSEKRGREENRLQSGKDWYLWGPYLPERQWGTVREDYSSDGNCWDYFTYSDSISKAYSWGEDGLHGLSDNEGFLTVSVALWNGVDDHLKERLFGLTNAQGNHGEDCKELYYYLDGTPTHSYCKALYKYPLKEFPYQKLIRENQERGVLDPEYEILDTGIFDEDEYCDVQMEYAKANPKDILIRYTVLNRSSKCATLHIMPTLVFRKIWAVEIPDVDKPVMMLGKKSHEVILQHPKLGEYSFYLDTLHDAEILFTENETNPQPGKMRPEGNSYKDAFQPDMRQTHRKMSGTKCMAKIKMTLDPLENKEIRCRLINKNDQNTGEPLFGHSYNRHFEEAIKDADEFYRENPLTRAVMLNLQLDKRMIARQACAGLTWSKQFYFLKVLEKTSSMPRLDDPAAWGSSSSLPSLAQGKWFHLQNEDVIMMPDKWEFPWYAPWDLCLQLMPYLYLDLVFAKEQIQLLLSHRYMHPTGELPSCEFNFNDPNPPLHAWAVFEIFMYEQQTKDIQDLTFLKGCFHKLIKNFTWWLTEKHAPNSVHLFVGGFLGLDNISVLNRSEPPAGCHIVQADASGWMAFYAASMVCISSKLYMNDPTYIDVVFDYLNYFVDIACAMQELWNQEDKFFYDKLYHGGQEHILRIISWVGVIPMIGVRTLERKLYNEYPEFKNRLKDFIANKPLASKWILIGKKGSIYLTPVTLNQLTSILERVFDPTQLMSPFGVRSLSKVYASNPYEFYIDGHHFSMSYNPGESVTKLYGGNSNWTGPVWLCMNYLLCESLDIYNHIYPNRKVCIFSLNQKMKHVSLFSAKLEIAKRICSIFLPNKHGSRPCHGEYKQYQNKDGFKNLILFHEYFNAESGKGCGASHQTGWTALVTIFLKWLAENAHDGATSSRASSGQRS